MTKKLLCFVLALGLAPMAVADDEDYSWCKGYVVKALGEFPVQGLSRINLWLDWNASVEQTQYGETLDENRYQAGRNEFMRLHNAGDTQGMIDTSEEECAIGRTKGWVWW